MIANPRASKAELGARYGYTKTWITNIQHSDAFQAAYHARRRELVDPALEATVEDRFRGLVMQSMEVLQTKLESPNVSDSTVLKALELGAKGLGVGGNAPPVRESSSDHLAGLANRLIDLQSNIRKGVTLDAQAEQVPAAG